MVYPSFALKVTSGANFGDDLSFADELILDDVYQINKGAAPQVLSLEMTSQAAPFIVTHGTQMGRIGRHVHLDCTLTFMAPNGQTFEALVLVEVEDDHAEATYLMPLVQMHPDTDYRLVGVDRDNPMKTLAQTAAVYFTKGTHITLSDGRLTKIEDLREGDYVMTRNNGPQEIKWIGRETIRAVGDLAPVLISKGALNNVNDLVLSPDHRLFVYQRRDAMNAGRPQILIKARHLINGTTVTRQEGGFVDYFQLLFDDHYMIYAEGIAAESMLIDGRTQLGLPSELTEHLAPIGAARHNDLEVTHLTAGAGDLIEKLKAASAG